MEIEIEKRAKTAVINLFGRLDVNSAPDLRKAALTLYAKGRCKDLTIDFGEVPFIDTSGLATLLEILVAAKERRARLALSGLKEKVRYLIEVNGLTGFFTIANSPREGLPQ